MENIDRHSWKNPEPKPLTEGAERLTRPRVKRVLFNMLIAQVHSEFPKHPHAERRILAWDLASRAYRDKKWAAK